MNDACPDYYKMSPYVDLNHWAARKLEASPWTRRDDAILLHVLWVEMLRYVVRLPFKATNAAGAISDIDKAISLLQDMRAALQVPEVVQDEKTSLAEAFVNPLKEYLARKKQEQEASPEPPQPPAPTCPQCGKPLDPSTAGFAYRGDWWCVPCLKAYWNHDLAPVIPWDALPPHEQEHIRNCDGRGGPWYKWQSPTRVPPWELLTAQQVRDCGADRRGTLYHIAVPQEVCNATAS